MWGVIVFLVIYPNAPVLARVDIEVPQYEWEIEGDSTLWTTVDPELPLPDQGRLTRVRVRVPGGPWSDWSRSLVTASMPGDLNWDGCVGVADYAIFGANFGRCE